MVSVIAKVAIWITILSLQYNYITTQSAVKRSVSTSNQLFATVLHPFMVDNYPAENVVYSPVSIYTSMALTYLGAAGDTAKEMRRALWLTREDKRRFAWRYGKFLRATFNGYKSHLDAPQLSMANRLYVSQAIKIAQPFNEIAQKHFDTKAQNVDFSKALTAVQKINSWVEEQTKKKIKDLLKSDAVNADTNAVLVNAIYFYGKWSYPFEKDYTQKDNFYISSGKTTQVDTMYTENEFRYAKLSDLDAAALELPYNNSDISMLILLPNQIDGLRKLENKLRYINLYDISSQMTPNRVRVLLPKFRIDFGVDLKGPLMKMGIVSIFNQNANLSGIFESSVPQRISDITHKAILECNEAGTEAAGATYVTYMYRFGGSNLYFRVNRPFAFFIRNKSAVFFAGHVTKL